MESNRCCSRSRSNHRCCYNARYRNLETHHFSSSSNSTSTVSLNERRQSSSEKTSSGYGTKRPTSSGMLKRRRRSSHDTPHKSSPATGTCKVARVRGDDGYRTDSPTKQCRSGDDHSHSTKPTNHTTRPRQRSRSGHRSRGPSPRSQLRNGQHVATRRGDGRVDGHSRTARKAEKRRYENARRRQSHERHNRKPSPIVVIGDVIKRRFRVEKLIGEGSYGQVFECFDMFSNSMKAIKVLKPQDNYKDVAKHEVKVLESVTRSDTKHRSHCISCQDYFDWHDHFFIVFPLLGPSVFTFLEENNYEPYPIDQAASIIRQLCEAVDHLRGLGLTHTDLKPENILFHDSSFSEVYSSRRGRHVRQINNPSIRLIDFGSATYDDDRHSTTIQTRHYRAPEVVLEIGWDHTADMWSIGCILFELVTGQCLFMTHDNLEHLAMMERFLGPLPQSFIERSRRRRYFRRGRLDWSTESSAGRHVRKVLRHLSDYWFSSPDLHTRLAFDLVKEMLAYNGVDRISHEAALHHPFLLSFES